MRQLQQLVQLDVPPAAVARRPISGAGSTFAAPVYEQWASAQSGLTVNYQAVGSGAGITSLEAKTVDFGASDPPLKPAEFAALEKVGPVLQIPMFLGAITVSYNLPGVKTGLKLEGKTIADIFLGKIKTWNDPAITALNPGVTLPSTPITVIHRSDSSGTTAGFTGFLAAVDPEFKSKVGEGKDVQWPAGTGAKGNAGVAGAVQQTAGAVGYVEQAYALAHKFTYASVKNKAGNFVAPTPRLDERRRQGCDGAGEPRDQSHQPERASRIPDHLADVHRRLQGIVQGGHSRRRSCRQGGREVPQLRPRRQGQAILSQADYAALPPAILEKSKAAAAAARVQRLAARRLSQARACMTPRLEIGHTGSWRRHRSRAASARSSGARRSRACPTACCGTGSPHWRR